MAVIGQHAEENVVLVDDVMLQGGGDMAATLLQQDHGPNRGKGRYPCHRLVAGTSPGSALQMQCDVTNGVMDVSMPRLYRASHSLRAFD